MTNQKVFIQESIIKKRDDIHALQHRRNHNKGCYIYSTKPNSNIPNGIIWGDNIKISQSQVNKLIGRKGIRRDLVTSFLNTLSDCQEDDQKRLDTISTTWNLATVRAARDGIRIAYEGD